MNTISTSVNILVCTSIQDILTTTHEDAHLKELMTYIIQGWLHKEEEVDQSIRQHWPIRNELAMIDGTAMKGKRIIIPFQLQK